jgi:hypothetical protein
MWYVEIEVVVGEDDDLGRGIVSMTGGDLEVDEVIWMGFAR